MKILLRLMAICLTVALVVVLSGFTMEENNAAVVDKDFGCFVNWAAIEGDYDGYMYTEETIIVSNNGGNVMLSCQFSGVENPPDVITKASGFGCGTWYGGTTNTKALLTPSGEGVLKCFIKKPKE